MLPEISVVLIAVDVIVGELLLVHDELGIFDDRRAANSPSALVQPGAPTGRLRPPWLGHAGDGRV